MTQAKEAADHSHKGGALARVLGGFDVFWLAVGAMIGWGWVVLAGTWVAGAGMGGAMLAFALGGLAVGLIGLTYAELVSALPYAGGEHVFVERAFGNTAAFIATWAIVLGYVSVVAFEAIALPVALVYLFPGIQQVPLWQVAGYQVYLTDILIGSGMAVLVAALNVFGAKAASRVQGLVVLLVIAAGAVLIAGGFVAPDSSGVPMWTGWGGVASVLIMVPFLFVGFDVIPQSAEEIDLPQSRVGVVLVLSILFGSLFYMGIVFGVGALPIAEGEALPTAAAASALWGSPAIGTFIVVAGIAGIATSWNAFLIGGSRAIFAMARAGQLPASLAAVHPRFGTPHAAIIFIGIISALAPALGRSALVWFVDAGGLAIVLAYLFVTAAFLKLRLHEPQLDRPYRTPFGIPVGAAAFVLSLGLLVLYLPGSPASLVWPQEWLIVVGWAVIGAGAFALARVRARNARLPA